MLKRRGDGGYLHFSFDALFSFLFSYSLSRTLYSGVRQPFCCAPLIVFIVSRRVHAVSSVYVSKYCIECRSQIVMKPCLDSEESIFSLDPRRPDVESTPRRTGTSIRRSGGAPEVGAQYASQGGFNILEGNIIMCESNL